MTRSRPAPGRLMVLALVLLGAACGPGAGTAGSDRAAPGAGCPGQGSAAAATSARAGSPATSAGSRGASGSAARSLSGPLTLLAAASLTEPFDDARARLEREHPGLRIDAGYAGSQELVAQIRGGRPADVVATADTTSMEVLTAAGLVDAPVVFARNRLEIVVAPGNPQRVCSLADLARADLAVAINDPSVPAGRAAMQALRGAGVDVAPRTRPLDVKAELRAVASGEADAGIVYVTDVSSAGSAVTGVVIPDRQNLMNSYPIGVLRDAEHRQAALALVDDALHGVTRAALDARGFMPP